MKEGSAFTQIIEANSAEDLRTKVLNLAAVMGGGTVSTGATAEAAPATAPSSEGPKSKKTKTKEAAPAAPASVDPFAEDEEEAEEEVEEKKLTFDDIKKHAQEYVEKQGGPKDGIPKLTELLGKWNDKNGKPVVKITALLEKDYPAFVAAAAK